MESSCFSFYSFWHASFMPCQSCPALSHHFNQVRREVPFTKLFTVQFLPSHVQYLLSTEFARSPAGVIIRISYFSRHGLDRHDTFEDSVLVESSLFASLQFSSFIDGCNNRHLQQFGSIISLPFKTNIVHSSGPGSSIGIATDYGLEAPGSNPGGDEIFRPSRPALGPTQPPVKWVPGLSWGKVRPRRAADHSPPSSAAVQEEQSYTSIHPLGHIGL